MNKEQLIEHLGKSTSGDRASILADDNYRNLITRNGATLHLHTELSNVRGVLKPKTFLSADFEKLKTEDVTSLAFDVSILAIRSLSVATGKMDGLGAFGGLVDESDKTDAYESVEKTARNGATRELHEELAELGLTTNFKVPEVPALPIIAHNDDFIIKKWDPRTTNNVFAVNAFCFPCEMSVDEMDRLVREQKIDAEKAVEIGGLKKISLFEALCAYKTGDKERDYRYAHEYFAHWAIAADLIRRNYPVHKQSEAFKKLALDIQEAMQDINPDCRLDLLAVAREFLPKSLQKDYAKNERGLLKHLDICLGLPVGTFEKTTKATRVAAKNKQHYKKILGELRRNSKTTQKRP